MTFNPDDPKWTAYILGELEDSERAEMDSLLESSEDARAYLEELRVAAGALEQELKVELKVGFPPEINAALAAGMTDAQRAAVLAAAGGSVPNAAGAPNNVRWFRRLQPQQAWLGGIAIAAMILIAVAIPSVWKAQKEALPLNVPVASATAQETDESIPPSPVIEDQKVSAPAGDRKIVVPDTTERNEARSQAQESTLSVESPATAKKEVAATSAATTPNPSGNPPSGNVIRDIFTPIAPAPPRPAAVGGGFVNTVAQGGIISGSVTDPSGALIPGVTVSATNTETAVVKTVQTNESGAYSFVGLTPGPYRVSASLSGFQTAMLVNINLGTAEAQRVDIAMKLGNSAAIAVAVATDAKSSLTQSSAATGQPLQNLPNNEEDLLAYLTQLAQLRGGGTTNITVDGFSAGILPPQAQIAEIQTSQAPFQAGQQGQQGQGQQGRQAAAGGGIGTGQGNGVGSGTRGGVAAGAPPPPPPPPPSAVLSAAARERIIPDNPTVVGFFDNIGRVNTASYAPITDNPFLRVSQEPLSTFSSDVDTASYANLRRFINQNQLPPAAAVRIEEMINYFPYDYAQPSGRDPIGASMEIASAPWSPTHRLVRIGIKARDIDARRRPSSNLVFLIDVSGSMQPQERLPLIKNGLKMLVGSLTENDHVSLVVYASASGVVLPSTGGNRKDLINAAIDRLEAGGSTNGGAGIQQAYQIATANFIPGGVNRVILATDGDFNVGVTNQNDLTRLIQERAKSGVFLSVLGVGTDNLKDSTMERLADTGNGNYAYLDSLNEAYKVLVEQMSGTLVTVAKDVKLQVEFNPARVEAYRLIGYENRLLANPDFNNDRKDAGDMGAGHTVTALYEIIPRGGAVPGPDIDPLKYQTPAASSAPAPRPVNSSPETLTLKIRYKDPDGTESKLLSLPLTDREGTFAKAGADFRFAASVAEFGMILRNSPYRGKASVGEVIENAQASKGSDRNGYRQEFIQLVQRARSLRGLE